MATVLCRIQAGQGFELQGDRDMPPKLCAASRCVLTGVPEVVELKVEYRSIGKLQSISHETGNEQDQ